MEKENESEKRLADQTLIEHPQPVESSQPSRPGKDGEDDDVAQIGLKARHLKEAVVDGVSGIAQ
ncbi:MAG: hypothetical protein R2843_16685 [Thermomicrobiales bacterium]